MRVGGAVHLTGDIRRRVWQLLSLAHYRTRDGIVQCRARLEWNVVTIQQGARSSSSRRRDARLVAAREAADRPLPNYVQESSKSI